MAYEKMFDDYVAYQTPNSMAKQVLRMLVEDETAQISSPILLVGDAGTGKTHLVNAVLEGYIKRHPEESVLCLGVEEFAGNLVPDSEGGNREAVAKFKAECRNRTSLLIVEDIHLLYDKSSQLEEVARMVDFLTLKSCKVILTAEREPRAYSRACFEVRPCPEISSSIIKCLTQGLTLYLHCANLSERTRILRNHCKEKELQFSAEVEAYICHNIISVSRLIDAVNRLAVWGNGNFMLSVSECAILLRDLVIQRNDLKCDRIVAVVAECFGYSPQQLVSKTRNPHVLLARQTAEYLAFRLLDCSLIDLEAYFERDRCTISYSIDKISKECAQNEAMRSRVENLIRLLVPER